MQKLSPDDHVKLIFAFDCDDPKAPAAERMWVKITSISRQKFEGLLDNDPAYIQDIKCGDPISFQARHIIQVSIDDPTPSIVDRYIARCFVSHRILKDRQRVGYLYREDPDTEEDSGWRLLAGDESDEYVDDSNNLSFVSLGAVLNIDDSFVDLLESPAGCQFAFDDRTGEFVAVSS